MRHVTRTATGSLEKYWCSDTEIITGPTALTTTAIYTQVSDGKARRGDRPARPVPGDPPDDAAGFVARAVDVWGWPKRLPRPGLASPSSSLFERIGFRMNDLERLARDVRGFATEVRTLGYSSVAGGHENRFLELSERMMRQAEQADGHRH